MKRTLSLILIVMLCLSLWACGESTPSNTDGSDGAEGTTGATTIPEEEQMQKLIDYNKALDSLDSLNTEFSRNQFEAMNKAYAILVSLGDYKNAPDLLSRFTECTYKKDNQFDYTVLDRQGVCLAQSTDGREYRCTNSFNDKGELVKVDFKGKEKPYFRTYEYNDAGQLIREDVVYEYQTTSRTYEYDANGNLTTEYYSYHSAYENSKRTSHFTYTFDDAGRIIKEREEYDDHYIETTYAYDEDGLLIGKNEYASEYGSLGRYTYTYDESGNLITTELTTEQNGSTWYSETKYTYTTLYFYTPPQE